MPTCARCGFASTEVGLGCPSCGNPFPAPRLTAAKASLVLGLLSYPLLCVFGSGLLTALLAVVFGIGALVRAARAPSIHSGRSSAVWGIVLGGSCMATVAVVALPMMVATRIRANEAAAISDIRAVIDAEFAYARVNGDLFDSLECLAAPARCVSSYGPKRAGFIRPDLATTPERMGYARTFHGGPAAHAGSTSGASPSSLKSWAYVAVPVSPGWSGQRAFCGDSSGRVCATDDGTPPVVTDGRCAESCRTLR